MVEYGIVKFFDGRDGKRFGFLTVLGEDGDQITEEIFFHFNDGEFVTHNGFDAVVFDGNTRRRKNETVRLDSPQKGDKLVFQRARGKGGKAKACPWAYAEQWDWNKELLDHSVDDLDDYYDPRDDEEICDGICGQPAHACTCAETESYRAFQADPATRGSWWTA